MTSKKKYETTETTEGADTSATGADAAESTGTAETPEGAGTAYTQEASATANSNGKASATAAGGDPVNSPVIGNPGEARPDMSYDYALAGATQATQPLASVEVAGGPKAGKSTEPAVEYAKRVRARLKGHYDGVREVGDEFDNEKNLATYPEDPNSWFESAE